MTKPFVSILLMVCFASGCRMAAPIHTWNAAKIARPGVVRVAIAPVGVASRAMATNDIHSREVLQKVAIQLEESLRQTTPAPNPHLVAIYPSDLAQSSDIQLVSYDNQPNESATVGAARSASADLLLQGNIVFANLDPVDSKQKKSLLKTIFGPKKPVHHLTVHWTVIDVPTGQRMLETTIETTDFDVKKSSSKSVNTLKPHDIQVLSLASYRGWKLVSSQPQATEILLDLPWAWLGATQVRKGNGYARQGRWDQAEQEWQSVADAYPTNAAAWHNLALAAVAREDFALARSRLKHADSMARGRSTFETELWIEKQQRQYHAIMNLPPPPDGWSFPDSAFAGDPASN